MDLEDEPRNSRELRDGDLLDTEIAVPPNAEVSTQQRSTNIEQTIDVNFFLIMIHLHNLNSISSITLNCTHIAASCVASLCQIGLKDGCYYPKWKILLSILAIIS